MAPVGLCGKFMTTIFVLALIVSSFFIGKHHFPSVLKIDTLTVGFPHNICCNAIKGLISWQGLIT